MEAAVSYPDWSGLPEDLLALVMGVLPIPDLLRAGAVCRSWYAAYSAVRSARFPIKDASPCLLYSCAGDDADTATLYSPSSGAAFKVRLPGPAFRSCYVLGSGHGWVLFADEVSNLHLVNPLTAAQVELLPVTELYHAESFSDDQGSPMYNLYGEDFERPESPMAYNRREMRLFLYERACLSCSPSRGAACVVLLLHRPFGEISFARLGDQRWTNIDKTKYLQWTRGYRTAVFNDKDGLFYLLSYNFSIYTLDLESDSPVMHKVFEAGRQYEGPLPSLIFAPWGGVLQVWRSTETTYDNPVHVPEDFTDEVIDPGYESRTDYIELCKVDINGQELVKVNSSALQGHAVFISFNSPILVLTEDFPMLKPNCVYTTDDSWENICINIYGSRDVGIWNFEAEALESLGGVQLAHPWLNWPPPVWMTPSLS